MCGISGIVGPGCSRERLGKMLRRQQHRGPDSRALYIDPRGPAGLAHNRLSILDLSEAGRQPMSDPEERYHLVFNGEIYNYLELRRELAGGYPFRSDSDSEVLLAAYKKWGLACLDRLIGMFSFAVWDKQKQCLTAVRDRFGVKPFYYHCRSDGTIFFASEIKALHAGGIDRRPDPVTWATYLAVGHYDHSKKTFWQDIRSLPPGHTLVWQGGRIDISSWYDLAERVGPQDDRRDDDQVAEEYLALLKESISLRFRADVQVGINLSGGLDSSTLLGLVQAIQGADSKVRAFTFITGDPHYDELPWVREMLAQTRHPLTTCLLSPAEVPELTRSVNEHQDEPFGGIPTLAYAKLFEIARQEGVIVLLDGQGMDEQWAGYDYYRTALTNNQAAVIQGTTEKPVRPDCLLSDFRNLSGPIIYPSPFPDRLKNLQYRDIRFTKIPRALRFNDRISMRASTELREPFLDHRLVELAIRQPDARKINNRTGKLFLRQLVAGQLPTTVVEAPKRPLQTPQREWLRGPLREWANHLIMASLQEYGGIWLDRKAVQQEWQSFLQGKSDNSFYVWQWISIGLMFGETG